MKIFDHTIYASTKIDRHDKTSALSAPSVVDTYQYSYRVNIYSGSESAWTLDKEITFTYDGWNLIQEQTTSGSDVSLTNSAFTQFRTSNYTYDANGNGLEEALYKGFAFELIDTAGVVKAHYEYSPFGKVVHKSGPLADKTPFQFSTKYLDNETQLYYYGYRYYNPENGRWINLDPFQELGGLNLIQFIRNNPIDLWDFLGLSTKEVEKDVLKAIEQLQKSKVFFNKSTDFKWKLDGKPTVIVTQAPHNKCTESTCEGKISTCTVTLKYIDDSATPKFSIPSKKPPFSRKVEQTLYDTIRGIIVRHELDHMKIWKSYTKKLNKSFTNSNSDCNRTVACKIAEFKAQLEADKYLEKKLRELEKSQKNIHHTEHYIAEYIKVQNLIKEYKKNEEK